MASQPYDYGFRPWSSVIKEGGEAVRGGIDSAFAGVRAGQARAAKTEEENRALHPLTQKYYQKVLSGEMTPAEAAVAAHTEIDANQNGIPDSQEQLPATAPPSYMGGGGPESGDHMTEPAASGGYGLPTNVAPSMERGVGPDAGQEMDRPLAQSSLRTGGMRATAAQPPPQPAMPPLTVRNLPELEAISRDVAARRQARNNTLTDEQWRDREDIKTQNKIKVEEKKGGNALTLEDKKAETKKDLFKQGLEQAWKIEWQRHLDRLQAMKDELDIATLKGDGEAIARIHAEAVRYAADQGVVGKIRSSINDFASEEAQKEALELYNRSHRIATTMAAETSSPTAPTTKTKTKLKSKKTATSYLVSPDGKIQVPVYEDGSKGPEEAGPNVKGK